MKNFIERLENLKRENQTDYNIGYNQALGLAMAIYKDGERWFQSAPGV